MNEEAMLKQRGAGWKRLHELSTKAGHTFKRLTPSELEEFVRLYRQTSADLAYLTTRSSNESVVTYLNEIVGRAYSQLYREPYRPWVQRLGDAVAAGAITVRRRRWAVFASIGIFLLGAVVSSGLLAYSDEFREFYVPDDGTRSLFEHWKSADFDPRTEDESSMMTAFYASHNPRVAILTNAAGAVSFGLVTTFLLWTNGIMLGALGFEMFGVGKLGFLLSSILPHGVTEMGGIFMAGAGGLLMGFALIRPGNRSRAIALREAGKDAFVFVLLSILMTLLAAPIEGFFSFDPRVPQWSKVLVAAVTFVAWMLYFGTYARGQESASIEGTEGPIR